MDQNQPSNEITSTTNSSSQQLSQSDERTWAMMAHLSILLNLVSGFLGIIAALLIYLAYKNRSKYVAYQSMQAFVFQLVWWLGGGLLTGLVWATTGVLSIIVVGLVLIPLACVVSLIPLAALVYGIVGAVECNNGHDFRYWLIGDWVRGELTRS
jgi:uncharacterized Tic20 family protein